MAAVLWGMCSMAQAGVWQGNDATSASCKDASNGSMIVCDQDLIVPSGGSDGTAQADTVNTVSAVPEPAAFVMLVVGLICMGGVARHVKSEPFDSKDEEK
jgi:hypothetical protein